MICRIETLGVNTFLVILTESTEKCCCSRKWGHRKTD